MKARAKALPCPGQDEDPDPRICLDLFKDPVQSGEIGRLQPIVLARAVEPHQGAAIALDEDRWARRADDIDVVGHPSSFLRSLVQIVFRSLRILRNRWRHRNLMANRLPLALLIFGVLAMPAAAQTVVRTPSGSTGFATPDGAVQLPATGTASSTAALVSGS